jgi:hypothetical protein
MKHLLLLAFACSFAGASCETPSPLVRACPGSAVQTAYYRVSGDCGGEGVITVTVASADSCLIGVLEPSGVGLPTVGSFSDLGGQTGYEITKGNWNVNDPGAGSNNVGTFLTCTAGAASSAGVITLACEQNLCIPSENEDVTCTMGMCTAHLTPASADAGIVVPPQDATIDSSP